MVSLSISNVLDSKEEGRCWLGDGIAAKTKEVVERSRKMTKKKRIFLVRELEDIFSCGGEVEREMLILR